MKFSKKSTNNLKTCDYRLRMLAIEVLKKTKEDFSIICGHRGEEEQNIAFLRGKSKAKYGESKHNLTPSKAFDFAPYPVDWSKKDYRWWYLVALFQDTAKDMGLNIKSGAFFKGFEDIGHIELL